MTMNKALHPIESVDRLYVSRREGEKGLASIEDSVDALIQRFEDYIQKRRGRLITATRNNTNDTKISGSRKKNKSVKVSMTDKQHLTRENVDMAKKRKP